MYCVREKLKTKQLEKSLFAVSIKYFKPPYVIIFTYNYCTYVDTFEYSNLLLLLYTDFGVDALAPRLYPVFPDRFDART